MKNLLYYVGIRHFRLKPLRSFLTFLGVAFGVALYVAISMINDSTRKSFRENIDSVAGKSKFTIDAGPAGFPEEKAEILRKVPGVKFAVPMLENRAFLANSETGSESLYMLGVDLLQEQGVRSYQIDGNQRVIDDPLVFLNQPDSVILTDVLAKRLGLKIDSKVELATSRGKEIFTVRGILKPEGAAKAYGGNLAIMDIDGARVMFGKEGKIDRVDIVPIETADLKQLKKDLETAMGSGFNVEAPETKGDNMEKMVRSYQMMLTFFSSLALLVGLFLVYNSTSVSIAERRREIGILRALGASRVNILVLFVLEASLIGFLGSALGCLLGKGLSHLLVEQVATAASNQYATPIKINVLILHLDQILTTLALGTFTSAFAAFVPSYKASKVSPTEAMRSRGMETSREKSSGILSILPGFLIYLFAIAIMYFEMPKYWAPFEQVSQGFSVIGSAFFGPTLVFLLIHTVNYFLKRIKSGSKRTLLNLAQQNLLRSRSRTSSNVMALMVGLYFVMLVATVRSSFEESILDWLDSVFTSDLIVTGSGSAITVETQPINAEIIDEILKIPGIKHPGEGRGSAVRISRVSYKGTSIFLRAQDEPGDFANYRNFAIVGQDRISTAKRFFASEEPAVFVSENFALKHPEKKVGDLIEINTPSGAVNFRIISLVRDFASSEGVFHIPRKVYQKYWNDKLISSSSFSWKIPPTWKTSGGN